MRPKEPRFIVLRNSTYLEGVLLGTKMRTSRRKLSLRRGNISACCASRSALAGVAAAHGQALKILSIAFPLANSSTNLSR